eukprot:6468359-Amphidinium_carterae.1
MALVLQRRRWTLTRGPFLERKPSNPIWQLGGSPKPEVRFVAAFQQETPSAIWITATENVLSVLVECNVMKCQLVTVALRRGWHGPTKSSS